LLEPGLAVLIVVTAGWIVRQAEEDLRQSEERFGLFVSSVTDYAILMFDPEGRVISWNNGAQRVQGYRSEEIIGQHFSRFYLPEDVRNGEPDLI
jgi:PAS domain-containing protein